MRFTLYLQPERGPCSPLTLDLEDVFRTLALSESAADPDEEQMRRLEAAIGRAFPGVQPESGRAGLRHILRRLPHVSVFDGVVLVVRGEIPEPPRPLAAQVREMEATVRSLSGQLESQRQARSRLEGVVRQLTDRLERAAGEALAAQRAADAEIQRIQALERAAREEAASLRAELDRGAGEAELAALRLELEALRKERDGLRETVAQRDGAIADLEDEVRLLRSRGVDEGKTGETAAVVEPVPF